MQHAKAGLIAALALAVVLAFFGWADLQKAMGDASAWTNPLVTPAEVDAIYWLKNNTPARTIVMDDIFGGETLMAIALRASIVGGDWTTSPDATQRMGDATRFYKSESAEEAHAIALQYNASFAMVPDRQMHCGFGWETISREKFANSTYFEKVFEKDNVFVYRIK